jgi:large subunit ribosomal protein L29
MKPEKLRELTKDEILQWERDLEEEIFNLRIQHFTGKLENPLRIREARRDLARVKTILQEDELGMRVLASKEKGDVRGERKSRAKEGESGQGDKEQNGEDGSGSRGEVA